MKILAYATRWFNRAPRTEKECAAYLDGIFDAGIENNVQAALEKLMKELQAAKPATKV